MSVVIVNIVDCAALRRGAIKVKKRYIWTNAADAKTVKMWKNLDKTAIAAKYGRKIAKAARGGEEEPAARGGGDEITFDEAELAGLLEGTATPPAAPPGGDAVVPINNIHIFPEDSVADFKNKITLAAAIPPYRQHIWHMAYNRAWPIGYRAVIDVPVRIDIRDIATTADSFEGIPIDAFWYANRDRLIIHALDHLTLMTHIAAHEFYVADLHDFIAPVRGALERAIRGDRLSTELVYHAFIAKFWPHFTLSAFGEYVTSETALAHNYPAMAPNPATLLARYTRETQLMAAAAPPMAALDSQITRSIVELRPGGPANVVDIRAVFDLFALSDQIPHIAAIMMAGGRRTHLAKHRPAARRQKTRAEANTITFTIAIPGLGITHFTIHRRASYRVESVWGGEARQSFEGVYNFLTGPVNDIIATINRMGILAAAHELPPFDRGNALFTSMNIELFWRHVASRAGFEKIRAVFAEYAAAGIITRGSGPATGASMLEYQWAKGMYVYNMARYTALSATANQFEYLTNAPAAARFAAIVLRRKGLTVAHRFSDIRIEISGIDEREYPTVYKFITAAVAAFPVEKNVTETDGTRLLKQLKERDPVLYDMRGRGIVYAKLCQKRKQPAIFNNAAPGRVKYWNFTTKSPAYYACPHADYPHINFIANMHPDRYCLPCCYKMPPSTNSAEKKSTLYRSCLENKTYERKGRGAAAAAQSRYIMAYGGIIEVGRLSKLPEHTLEPLFYDTFHPTIAGIDGECERARGYHIFGVPQNAANVRGVGFLFSVAHALRMNVIRFAEKSIEYIRAGGEAWNSLLGGTAGQHFAGPEALSAAISAAFVNDGLSDFTRWNELFADITRVFWGIPIIIFADVAAPGARHDKVELRIPGNVKHIEEWQSDADHIMVIESAADGTVYPVYLIDVERFFKTGSIHRRTHAADSIAVREVTNIIAERLLARNTHDTIDAHLIQKFAEAGGCEIVRKYVNRANMCYGALIAPAAHAPFYFPFAESRNVAGPEPITFESPAEADLGEWTTIEAFMAAINKFIEEAGATYPPMRPERWLTLPGRGGGAEIVGFSIGDINYMMRPAAPAPAPALPRVALLYNPFEVNRAIAARLPPAADARRAGISAALYDRYAYRLLTLELMRIVNSWRNEPLRAALAALVRQIKHTDMKRREIYDLLADSPEDRMVIQRMIYKSADGAAKGAAAAAIDRISFDFDRAKLIAMRDMPRPKLIAALGTIFAGIVDARPDFGEGKAGAAFPNIFTDCSVPQPFCAGGRLMIPHDELAAMTEIMAADIQNPAKFKYIFSPIFARNIVNQFDFITRPGERITIS